MKLPLLLLVLGLTVFIRTHAAATTPAAATPPRARHLVLLVVDDLGFGDLGYTGSGIKTPVLDGLAEAGVTLGQFYVMRACSPTRASLQTGRFVIRYGMQSGVIETGQAFGLDLGETTLPQALKRAHALELAQDLQQQPQRAQCSGAGLHAGKGWDCGGGGIAGHTNLNISEPAVCCAACAQLPACEVWTVYPNGNSNSCFLKKKTCKPVQKASSWSGGAQNWTPPPPPSPPSHPCSSRAPAPPPAPDSWATHAVGKWHLGFCEYNNARPFASRCPSLLTQALFSTGQWRSTPSFRGYDSYLGYYTCVQRRCVCYATVTLHLTQRYCLQRGRTIFHPPICGRA